ncbi:hypothetical protein ABBQ32_005390 [Trebouxia sp. C0010 RCD-2024]
MSFLKRFTKGDAIFEQSTRSGSMATSPGGLSLSLLTSRQLLIKHWNGRVLWLATELFYKDHHSDYTASLRRHGRQNTLIPRAVLTDKDLEQAGPDKALQAHGILAVTCARLCDQAGHNKGSPGPWLPCRATRLLWPVVFPCYGDLK